MPRAAGFGRSAAFALAAALLITDGAHAQARAQADAGAAIAAARGCGACHGAAGIASLPGMPSLAGQPAEYTALQLILFREGLRDVAPMTLLARGLSDDGVEALAAHYATLPPGPAPDRAAADPARHAAGAALAETLRCGSCHRPDYAGAGGVPRLAGQREDYALAALRGYRDGTRRGADTNMNAVVYGLDDAALAALAHDLAQR